MLEDVKGGKRRLFVENKEMGLELSLTLDPVKVSEYSKIDEAFEELLVNAVCGAISGIIGWRLFRDRLQFNNLMGMEVLGKPQ